MVSPQCGTGKPLKSNSYSQEVVPAQAHGGDQ